MYRTDLLKCAIMKLLKIFEVLIFLNQTIYMSEFVISQTDGSTSDRRKA